MIPGEVVWYELDPFNTFLSSVRMMMIGSSWINKLWDFCKSRHLSKSQKVFVHWRFFQKSSFDKSLESGFESIIYILLMSLKDLKDSVVKPKSKFLKFNFINSSLTSLLINHFPFNVIIYVITSHTNIPVLMSLSYCMPVKWGLPSVAVQESFCRCWLDDVWQQRGPGTGEWPGIVASVVPLILLILPYIPARGAGTAIRYLLTIWVSWGGGVTWPRDVTDFAGWPTQQSQRGTGRCQPVKGSHPTLIRPIRLSHNQHFLGLI